MSSKLIRGAGILMPVSSLPSPYGIGTLGKEAYRFADWLCEAGQRYWQVLPVGPTSFGDSPYQSFSAFAGNPYFIDLDTLAEEGLIPCGILSEITWNERDDRVNYSYLFDNRFEILKTAYKNSGHQNEREYIDFCHDNSFWLDDYALFMALKEHFDNRSWIEWDEDIRFRRADRVEFYKDSLAYEIDFWRFCQYKFFEQWGRLKKYVNERGIKIIGDIPLYVSLDSADVWAYNHLFEMDEKRRPVSVAGVPPDCFSEDGQLWGNPIYNWEVMEKERFDWWRKRMNACADLYDVIRIDHFIGIVRYYAIPADSVNAKTGEWRTGPGRKLTDIISDSVGDASIIAEDLGVIVPPVRELIEETGWPGMKIFEFAFDGQPHNEYLPHNYKNSNCVLYAGTHDNDTIKGFVDKSYNYQRTQVLDYIGAGDVSEIPRRMIQAAYMSIADVVIIQMQDVLELGTEARMNTPSTIGANWQWRALSGQINHEDAGWLRKYTGIYGRLL